MYHKRGDQYGDQSKTVTGLIFMHKLYGGANPCT